MTWAQLLVEITKMNDEQLQQDVTVHTLEYDEFFPANRLRFADENQGVLDYEHPYLEIV